MPRLALLASLVGLLALVGCDDARLTPTPLTYRNSFADGADGWAQFEALANIQDSDLGKVHSIKVLVFDVLTAPKVYFVNSKTYALHYDFAHDLDAKRFPTRDVFDQVVYWDPAHKHAMATLLLYPELTAPSLSLPPSVHAPLSLQFFPSDNQPPANARALYKLVRDRMPMLPKTGNDKRLVYTPANSMQVQDLVKDQKAFVADGVSWLLQTELYANLTLQACNSGVTFGTLRKISGDQLMAGDVSYRDIVLLERLPLDLPLVGGTITEEFQTPLAHVNLVAKAHKTPNLALRNASTDPRVQPFIGKLVRFEVHPGGFELREATADEINAFWKKKLDRPEFKPKTDLGVVGVTDLDKVGYGSSSAFGVKTSNYAELQKLFAQQTAVVQQITGGHQTTFTRAGLGVPFSAYEAHLLAAQVSATDCDDAAQDCAMQGDVFVDACQRGAGVCKAVVASDKATNLRAYIATIIVREDFLADSPLRAALLHGVRWKIEHSPVDATFSADLDAAILAKFGPHPIKMRLRSSTNAEDLPGFSGAGLYQSFTASNSDPSKSPTKVIPRTWGSVWTFRAFEERSYWRVSHLDVRMGVLIHESFPDEQCNGVIISENVADPTSWGFYVNVQQGEASVTNPEGGITPETFTIYWNWLPGPIGGAANIEVRVDRVRYSSLSPGIALMTDAEIGRLAYAMVLAHDHFAKLYGKSVLAFDAEFKINDALRNLYIKQIRPY